MGWGSGQVVPKPGVSNLAVGFDVDGLSRPARRAGIPTDPWAPATTAPLTTLPSPWKLNSFPTIVGSGSIRDSPQEPLFTRSSLKWSSPTVKLASSGPPTSTPGIWPAAEAASQRRSPRARISYPLLRPWVHAARHSPYPQDQSGRRDGGTVSLTDIRTVVPKMGTRRLTMIAADNGDREEGAPRHSVGAIVRAISIGLAGSQRSAVACSEPGDG
jgi:hypothetical protein